MDDIKSRIVASARGLYLERGPEGVTMRAVAERVGVTATALYRHFADKETLLREVAGEGSRLLGSHLFRALEAPTPLERLKATADAYLDFAIAQPAAYRALYDAPQEGEDAPLGRQQGAVRRFLRERVREAMEDGAVAQGDPDGVAVALWALVHGLAGLHFAGIVRLEWVRERSLTNLIEGVGPTGSTRTGG
jgi:AcrR family transcriptional regulator